MLACSNGRGVQARDVDCRQAFSRRGAEEEQLA